MMRSSFVITIIGAFLPLLLSSICITPPEPRPNPLSSPVFTNYNIIAKQYNDEYHEMVYLQWQPDTTDTISITSYTVIRKVDIDSFQNLITNIPADVNDLYDPTYKFIDADKRTNDRLIFYRIFAIATDIARIIVKFLSNNFYIHNKKAAFFVLTAFLRLEPSQGFEPWTPSFAYTPYCYEGWTVSLAYPKRT